MTSSPPDNELVLGSAIGYVYSATGDRAADKVAAGKRAVALLAAQQGLQLVACEADIGLGPRVARRAVCKALATGSPFVLIVPSLSHLSRSPAFAAKIIDRLLARGQHIVTCDGQLDSRTRPGRLLLGMMQALSELEAEISPARFH